MDQRTPEPRFRVDEEAPVSTLSGVGPKVAERLAALGIESVRDLAEHVPRDFLDWSEARGFAALRLGQEATVECTVERARLRPTRRRNLKLVEAAVVDGEGGRATAVWFNQAWLAERLVPGTRVLVHGQLQAGGTFKVERHELAGDGAGLHTVGLVPLYPASEAVSTTKLRELTERALPLVRWYADALPAEVRQREKLPLRADALAAYHRPARLEDVRIARERLALEELIVLQLGLLQRRRELEEESVAPALDTPGELLTGYRKALPFAFTPEQEQAIVEIDSDLRGTRPMQRLLQGDVGSGKTVVALYALLRAVERGHQGALMAPTETLAEQHYLTVEPICAALGVRAALLTGSVKGEIEDADLVVGTHALIQEGVEFRSLAVAVVDEQHRFGVEQRRALALASSRSWGQAGKGGERAARCAVQSGTGKRRERSILSPAGPGDGGAGLRPAGRVAGQECEAPHVLHMTATPIPRTLAQTVYGDLDVTEIARPPRGRRPVVTSWVSHERAAEAYTRLRRHLQEGRQAYVVCPLVSESEAIEARAAEQEAERLRQAELRDFRVGCLHGRMRPAERRAVMEEFKRGELNVLVATTVIEVGVDIPNATIMIVQEADCFGLAQLHQLRGRVGRGAEQSYCLLVSRPKEELTEEAQRRLEALVETSDGFKLAEVDLELRGEGQLLGTRQSGLPDLKFASLTRDRKLVEKARRWAEELATDESDAVQPLRRQAERLNEDHRGFA
jgi:ATP-dependent DNA helicase RecG